MLCGEQTEIKRVLGWGAGNEEEGAVVENFPIEQIDFSLTFGQRFRLDAIVSRLVQTSPVITFPFLPNLTYQYFCDCKIYYQALL